MQSLSESKIVFSGIRFTKPGVYRYTIREITPSDKNWKADTRVYRAVITVMKDNGSALSYKVEYPDGFPCFENVYCPCPSARPCDRRRECQTCYRPPLLLLALFICELK